MDAKVRIALLINRAMPVTFKDIRESITKDWMSLRSPHMKESTPDL